MILTSMPEGDSHSGRGIAALNLLSDLKDHCGWSVIQQERRTGELLVSLKTTSLQFIDDQS